MLSQRIGKPLRREFQTRDTRKHLHDVESLSIVCTSGETQKHKQCWYDTTVLFQGICSSADLFLKGFVSLLALSVSFGRRERCSSSSEEFNSKTSQWSISRSVVNNPSKKRDCTTIPASSKHRSCFLTRLDGVINWREKIWRKLIPPRLYFRQNFFPIFPALQDKKIC